MISTSRSLLLSVALLAAPLTGAMAQNGNPAGNYGSNRSMTAAPGTADNSAHSGMNTGDEPSRGTMSSYPGTASDPRKPGATSRIVVPGSNSSQTSAPARTSNTRTGAMTGGGM